MGDLFIISGAEFGKQSCECFLEALNQEFPELFPKMANVLVVAQNLDRSNAVKLLRKEIKKQICSTAEAGAPAGVPPAPVAASAASVASANAIVVPGLDVTVIMDEMQGMGFSREQCTAALNFAKGDKTEAVNFMLNNPEKLQQLVGVAVLPKSSSSSAPPPPPGVKANVNLTALPAPPAVVGNYERTESQIEAQRIAEELDAEEKKRSVTFNCPICMDDEADINGSYVLQCEHRVCGDCLIGYVTSKINNNELTDVEMKCPAGLQGAACDVVIGNRIVHDVTVGAKPSSPELYQKYLDFKTNAFIDSSRVSGSLKKCPNETCNYTFEYESESPLDFACPQCQSSFCLYCRANEGHVGPGHTGRTCQMQIEALAAEEDERRKMEEWREQNGKADELMANLMKDQGWAICPKCKNGVERNKGCDHMTCRCRHNFCYVCKNPSTNMRCRHPC